MAGRKAAMDEFETAKADDRVRAHCQMVAAPDFKNLLAACGREPKIQSTATDVF